MPSRRHAVASALLVFSFIATAREAAAQSGPYLAIPSWDQTIPGSKRFLVLTNFNKDAILDYETGLVWERAPNPALMIWVLAYAECANKQTGGRMGWRLPSMAELTSLIDPSVPSPGPMLPAGHPFGTFPTLGPGTFFWTSTPFSEPPFLAWAFTIASGGGATYQKDNPGFSFRAWCVRGPSSPGL